MHLDPMNSPIRSAPRLRLATILCATLALVAATVPPALAATPATGTIEGRVFNPRSGTVVENARISLESASLITFTDADGNFRLTQVPAGTAQLRIFYTGFAPQTENVVVAPGQTVQRDITLAVGKTEALKTDEKIIKLDEFVVGESREMEAAPSRSTSNASPRMCVTSSRRMNSAPWPKATSPSFSAICPVSPSTSAGVTPALSRSMAPPRKTRRSRWVA